MLNVNDTKKKSALEWMWWDQRDSWEKKEKYVGAKIEFCKMGLKKFILSQKSQYVISPSGLGFYKVKTYNEIEASDFLPHDRIFLLL